MNMVHWFSAVCAMLIMFLVGDTLGTHRAREEAVKSHCVYTVQAELGGPPAAWSPATITAAVGNYRFAGEELWEGQANSCREQLLAIAAKAAPVATPVQ